MPAALKPVNKSVNGTVIGYYLDGSTILIEKTNGTNTAQYTWGDGLIRCNGEYPLEDGRGNVRFTTNAAKTITSSNAPNAFGVGAVTSGTASAFSWNAKSGYRQDGVAPTGLSSAYSFQKVGDRYYDPTLSCFLTRDTELGQLPYTYCGGDPVNCVDPDGHKTKKLPPHDPGIPGGGAPGGGGSPGGGVGGGAGSSGGGNAGPVTIPTGNGGSVGTGNGGTINSPTVGTPGGGTGTGMLTGVGGILTGGLPVITGTLVQPIGGGQATGTATYDPNTGQTSGGFKYSYPVGGGVSAYGSYGSSDGFTGGAEFGIKF